ncbi:MAG TPA: hypothetical protein VMT70_24600 [Vicinamibacteria bacterium]|nr:hypothetical protein [Vicinamibacteria bacterium]
MRREKTVLSRGHGFALTFVLTLLAGPAFGQGDPAATGTHDVTTEEYTQGDTVFTPVGFPAPVEFTAVVFYPTDLANGPYPLVLYLHGRHQTCGTSTLEWPCTSGRLPILSYRGYDYSGQQLASQGYIVVSVSANGINARDNSVSDLGAGARAELIDRHLEFWRTLNTVGAAPFGTLFVGHVDLTRVGTMGHSRGGEGVMRHFSYNAAKASPFPLKVIVPIAPTNFSRWQVNQNVAVALILPYCDGDVSDLQGVHYYDDARYLMSSGGYQSYVTVMGADHNFFNTTWTPGLGPGAADDWTSTADPWCGTGAGNGRLAPADQRTVALAYLATFFRTGVGGESGFFGYIDGTAGRPPTVQTFSLHSAYQGSDAQRRDLNRLLATADLTTNFLGGATSQTGLSPHDLCGGASPQPQFCLSGQSNSRMPHTTPSSLSSLRGLSQLRTGWSALGAVYTNQIPAGPSRDVSQYDFLQFRVSVNFADGRNPLATAQNFSVRFIDGSGGTQSLSLGPLTDALFYPPGAQASVPKVLQHTVRVPLASLTGVNLADLAQVDLVFDQQASGALLLSDLHFYQRPGSSTAGASYFTLTPCRVADTRNRVGPSGGPALAANTARTFPVSGTCAVPSTALAVAGNLTVVNETDSGDLRVYPAGISPPTASAINFVTGKVRANNAVLPLGSGGQVAVQCDMPAGSTGQTDFVLDVMGYFQ